MLGSSNREARERFRNMLEKTHDSVLTTEINLNNLNDNFNKHIDEEIITFKDINSKIDNLSCPQEETIKLLKKHNDEQNGHLRELAEQGGNTLKKIDGIISESKGAVKSSEAKRNNWIFIISILMCLIAGIAACYTIMSGSNKKTIVELTEIVKDLKENSINNNSGITPSDVYLKLDRMEDIDK